MRIAFLTEMGFRGKVPINHPNARTEFAWMIALGADHFNIMEFPQVFNYDWVFLILPKGGVSLNSEGIRLNDLPNRYAALYAQPFVEQLKTQNKRVAYVQEGPSWYVNDFSLPDQFNVFNQLAECDVIFAHNEYDTRWYEGLFPSKKVTTIPTLMIEELIQTISPTPEPKAIIGGNFCRWYGGFQSYLVATEFNCPIFVQTSHCSQPGEEQVPNLNILPRLVWVDWIQTLSTFKYAVNLMPTVAAGTFSLNCAYLGIPCIANKRLDTQRICHPQLSVEAEDVKTAREMAVRLTTDAKFYAECSKEAKWNYDKFKLDIWQKKMYAVLQENL
jgi:hypothetical protein